MRLLLFLLVLTLTGPTEFRQPGRVPDRPAVSDLEGYTLADDCEFILDGQVVAWKDVPASGTEAVQIQIDPKRRVIRRLILRTTDEK